MDYINNEVKCFKTFAANRVQKIKENSNTEQWKYILSQDNPADIGSRGLDATKVNKVTRWFHDSAFPWKPESEVKISAELQLTNEEDPEVRREVNVNAIAIENCNILDMLKKNSSTNADQEYPCVINVATIKDTERIIIKLHQRGYFKDEVSNFIRTRNGEEVSLQNSSKISNVDLFSDENEVLVVVEELNDQISTLNTFIQLCYLVKAL